MPFVPPGSSEQFSFLSPVAEPPALVRDKLDALSVDEPLPEIYHGDRIRLLVQSPYRLHLYWSHARDPYETLRKAFGPKTTNYKMAVKIIDGWTGQEYLYEAAWNRSQWFNVRPDAIYRAEVGLFAQGRPFIRLLTSSAIRTPRVTVSNMVDSSTEFTVSAAEFTNILNESGYASDALAVALEAADEAAGQSTTQEVVREFTGLELPETVNRDLLAEMRSLIAALAFGVPLERLLSMVSPALAAWVERLIAKHQGTLDTARLLEILRAALGLELDQSTLPSAEEEEEMRRTARFVWGASDVQLPSRIPRLWIPSMTGGASSGKW